jgi:hypothetical protein
MLSASAQIYPCNISPGSIQGIVIYIFPKESNGNKFSDMSMSKADIRAYYPNDHSGIKIVVVYIMDTHILPVRDSTLKNKE